jgi:uncharacterized protein (DUF885 family)
MIVANPWRLGLLLPLLVLTACGRSGPIGAKTAAQIRPQASAGAAFPAQSAAALQALFQRYWDAYSNLNPLEAAAAGDERFAGRLGNPLSTQYLADSLALERSTLDELTQIDSRGLSATDALSYQIFQSERRVAIDGFLYPAELIALDPFDGLPQRFARMAAGVGAQSFASPRDFDNWLRRSDDFAADINQLIDNLRDGLRRGYSVPKAVVERVLPALVIYAQDDAANVFYSPLRGSAAFSAAERARIGPQLRQSVKARVLPAYAELARFLKAEYLPRARTSIALSELPLGSTWYAYEARRYTGADLTPAQLHALGLGELDRTRSHLQTLMAQAGLGGDMAGAFESLRHDPRYRFANTDEVAAAFKPWPSKAAGVVPKELTAQPLQSLEIRELPPFVSNGIDALVYAPNPATALPAVLFVEMTDLVRMPRYAVAASFMREGSPGRHWQTALQRENKTLPSFRRFGSEPAYAEGWALYAASLGEETGVFSAVDDEIGAVLEELRQNVLLVVDTGIQSQRWSRQRAVEYVTAQLPIAGEDAALQVDRCIAAPGRALAAPFGARRIRALRTRAQEALGANFDAAAFHAQVLNDGAIPLGILEAKIDRWLRDSH